MALPPSGRPRVDMVLPCANCGSDAIVVLYSHCCSIERACRSCHQIVVGMTSFRGGKERELLELAPMTAPILSSSRASAGSPSGQRIEGGTEEVSLTASLGCACPAALPSAMATSRDMGRTDLEGRSRRPSGSRLTGQGQPLSTCSDVNSIVNEVSNTET